MTKRFFTSFAAKASATLLLVLLLSAGNMMGQSFKYYRGFLDVGMAWAPVGNDFGRDCFNTGTITTTHGYYVGDRTFVGVGAGVSFDEELLTLPLYLDVRYNLSFTADLTPTFELRAGHYFDLYQGERASFYGDVAAGVRWALGGRTALNLMLNLSYYQGFQVWGMYYQPYGDWSGYTFDVPVTIGWRLGVEW